MQIELQLQKRELQLAQVELETAQPLSIFVRLRPVV
jgi:hypothetical protein